MMRLDSLGRRIVPEQHLGKHGHATAGNQSPTYKAWCNMKTRCLNSNNKDYHRYGAIGITVCERWLTFSNFISDMGVIPKTMTLERIDNNGGYSKENCRWASRADQNRNTVMTRFVEFNGKRQCITDWECELGFGANALRQRLNAGWSIENAFTTQPLR